MAELVYVLCAVTSLVCAGMLFRGFRRNRTQLLFWSCVCFGCFALTNTLLVVDKMMIPNFDLLIPRNALSLSGLVMLLYAMIRDTV